MRYKSKGEQGERDNLEFDPITIEKCLYNQIYEAVAEVKKIIEGIKVLRAGSLVNVEYPHETLHEILTNAVIHRDYSVVTDIQIRIFDNRVEIESPGRLPGHITVDNILDEQWARNGNIVRIINKFKNPPNKDVGEGLNTAFEAMTKMKLRPPVITELDNSVVVVIKNESLASPEDAVMGYLKDNDEITNRIARDLTGIKSENAMKNVFYRLRDAGLLVQVPEKRGNLAAWRKAK